MSLGYGGGKYVAVGSRPDGWGGNWGNVDGFFTDAINWSGRSPNPVPANPAPVISSGLPVLSDVAYGGGRFIAVCLNGSIIHIQENEHGYAAPTYITGRNPFGGTAINAITYGNGRFVAVGVGGKAAYSADGLSWTASSNSAFGTSELWHTAAACSWPEGTMA